MPRDVDLKNGTEAGDGHQVVPSSGAPGTTTPRAAAWPSPGACSTADSAPGSYRLVQEAGPTGRSKTR